MSLRNRKKKKYLMLLLLLVLGVTVGYAFLNTTLNINGTSKIKDAKWNVYWDNPQVTTGSVTETKPTIDSTKTTATFDITLNNPKDFYEFTIDAVNAGTIDAMIKVNGVSNKVYSDSGRTEETTLPDAIKYTVTYEDGGTISDKHLLAKKQGDTPTRETYKVRIEYRNDEQTTAQDLEEITEETTYYMTFSVEYVQADDSKIARNGATSLPTMDEMCPNCKYGRSNTSIGSTSISGYTDSYSSYTDGSAFVGIIIEEGEIKRAFACGIESGQAFCLEGGVTTASVLSKNIDILNQFYSHCEDDENSYCGVTTWIAGSGNDGNSFVYPGEGSGPGHDYGCDIYANGDIDCTST